MPSVCMALYRGHTIKKVTILKNIQSKMLQVEPIEGGNQGEGKAKRGRI